MTDATLRMPTSLLLLLFASPAPPLQTRQEADAARLDNVNVVGHRIPLAYFPGAVTVLQGDVLREAQRQVSLSETLQGVPGVIALERHNYAQDLQLQSRGFGARSTFGIRGLSLVADGIPASALDGQGQASGFALSMLDRIEVLRGPLALQFGNAAGGSIVGYSELGEDNRMHAQGWTGSNDSHRLSLRADGASGDWRGRIGLMRFSTDGHRPHSAARRDEAHASAAWTPSDTHTLRFTLDALEQPWTDDPLGLTPAQWRSDPMGTDPGAIAFDTRKRIENRQAGLRWTWRYAPRREAHLALWQTRREIGQFLAIPVAAQRPATHAGGMIDSGRDSTGLSISHRTEGTHGGWSAGIDLGTLHEARRGYENFVGTVLGVQGRLRRDESNRVRSREFWLSGERRFGGEWLALAAVRQATLRFESKDHYIVAGNGDDSGALRYRETAFSAGLARRLGQGEWFASVGRGYETPTVTELSYRPDGTGGLNAGLAPARFATAESGLRWHDRMREASIAIYRIEGRDEIVQVYSNGGRSSYGNAGRTRRDGLEAAWSSDPHPNLSYRLSANLIDARFREAWETLVVRAGQTEVRRIGAGRRIPGIPRMQGFAALDWHRADRTLALALEATGNSAIAADDTNGVSAPGHARYALALRWRSPGDAGWHAFARIDNAFDRRYIGSVIVNESNGRSFEPAPGRTFTLGVGWRGGE